MRSGSGSKNKNRRKPAGRKKKAKRRFLAFFIKICLTLFFLTGITAAATGYFVYEKYSQGLPDVMELKNYEPSLVTVIYSDTNDKIGEFFIERRILMPIEDIPTMMIQATISVEDSHFYSHSGIDIQGIIRAGIKNFMAGHVVEGGSTITQQLAKTMFLSPKRNIERKIREAILAINIERNFTKNEILEIYLNQIYYGHGAYGVEAAAQVYFDKSINDLRLSEIALLAALPRAPRNYSPYLNPQRAIDRRNYALRRLKANNYITEKEMKAASAEQFALGDRGNSRDNQAPCFMEYIRRYIEVKYGSSKLYRSGFHVYTTLNLDYQRAARKAIFRGLRANDKRYGFRGPLLRQGSGKMLKGARAGLTPGETIPYPWESERKVHDNMAPGRIVVGVVTEVKKTYAEVSLGFFTGTISIKDMSWARKPDTRVDGRYARIRRPSEALKVGDVIEARILPSKAGDGERAGKFRLALEQEPEVQAALLAVDPATGRIKAMVGGYDYRRSQFNRAVQARRQPGSAFKPIIYTAALEKGYTPATIVQDSPVIYKDTDEQKFKWKPKNFEEKFYGPTTIRAAIAHSRNLVTIKVLKEIGIRSVIDLARRLGINSPLSKDLSLALGSSGLTLMELTGAYSVFANHGVGIKPYAIRYIKNRDGKIIEENGREEKEILSPEIAFTMTSILKSVVEHGTGKKVSALGRPVAGKTGTTNNYIDAWFMGYTANLLAGVWVGLDKNESLGRGETGARAAAPIWLDFMKAAHKGKPVFDFPVPPGIIFKKTDRKTGLLAGFGRPFVFECFLPNRAPVQYAATEDEQEELMRLKSPL